MRPKPRQRSFYPSEYLLPKQHDTALQPHGLSILWRSLVADLTLQSKGCALSLGVPAFTRCAPCSRAIPLRPLALPLRGLPAAQFFAVEAPLWRAHQRKGNHMITNLDRANWADKAIRAFREQTRCDHAASLGDLLCDLMHWADASNFDIDFALDRAHRHFEEVCDEQRSTDSSPEPVLGLVEALERQTEAARGVNLVRIPI